MKMKASASAILMIIFLSVLSAQDKQPQEPDIVLPKMILEVAELKQEGFDAILPPPTEVPLDLSPLFIGQVPVPNLPESLLRPEIFSQPLSDSDSDLSSLYTQGTLGAGSMNGIVGGLSLYKTGEDAKYKVEFSHEGLDGYSFHNPGSGFFHRREHIGGTTEHAFTKNDVFAEAGFREEETGLQGTSEFYSALLRSVLVRGGFEWKPSASSSLRTTLGADTANRLLTGNLSREDTENTFSLESRGRMESDFWAFTLGGSYGIRSLSGTEDLPFQRAAGDMGLELYLFDFLRLNTAAGIAYNDTQSFRIPFQLGLSLNLNGSFALFAGGGKRIDVFNYKDFWNKTVFLGVQDSVDDGETLFGNLGFEMRTLGEKLYLKAGFAIEQRKDAVVLGSYDPLSAGYFFSQDDLLTYILSAESLYSPGRGLSLKGNYKAYLGDRALLEKTHLIDLGFSYAPEKSLFGADISGLWNLSLGNEVPEIGLTGYFRPREGLEISLSLDDILAPFLEEGRTWEAPFIAPGFRGMIKTVLSF